MAKLKSKLNLALAFLAGILGFSNSAYAQADQPKTAGSSDEASAEAEG